MKLLTRSEAARLTAGGALLALAFPPLPLGFLALVAFTPLLHVLDEDPRPGFRRGFTRGALYGSVFYLVLLFWLWDLTRFTILIAPTWLLSSLYLGALCGLAVGLAHWIRARTGRSPALLLPFAWLALEKALQYGDLRFTWGVVADALTPYPLLLQSAELWGALGLTFLIVAANGLLYDAWKHREQPLWRRRAARALAALSCALVVYGALRWAALPSPAEGAGRLVVVDEGGTSAAGANAGAPRDRDVPAPAAEGSDGGALPGPDAAGDVPFGSVRVAVVQPNISQELRNRANTDALQRRRLAALSRGALAWRPDLVVWPETAARWLRWDAAALEAVRALCCGAAGAGVPFLVGALDAEDLRSQRQRIFNAAFLVDERGQLAGTYRKALLVPMTEQVPYAGVLGLLKPEEWSGTFTPGEEFQPLAFTARPPGYAGEVEVGVPICYEITFPGAVRELRRNGARLVATITNDAWFGRTPAPYQHFSHLRLRAIEARIPIARAANTGVSGFVTARGDVLARTAIFTPAFAVADLPLAGPPTPYVRWGDWIVPAAWLALAGVLTVGRRSQDSRDSPPAEARSPDLGVRERRRSTAAAVP